MSDKELLDLEKYLSLLVDKERAVLSQRVCSLEHAIIVAKEEVDRRLEDMNELRRQINYERGTFVAKEWFERQHSDLTGRIEKVNADLTGRIEKVNADLTGRIEKVNADLTGRIEKVQTKQDNSDGSRTTWGIVLLISTSLVSFLFSYLLRKI